MNKRDLKKFRENYTDWEYGCPAEGLQLAVHFDEKDEVKRFGARWKPDPSGKGGYWWMPQAKCTTGCLQWLNQHQMIQGLHGTIDPLRAEEVVGSTEAEKYILSDGASEYHIMRFAGVGLIRFSGLNASDPLWFNEADGKETWNHLVASGFYRISEVSA